LAEITGKRRPAANWVVYVLDSGYCGVAHRECGVGDVVTLLPSINPLVLRSWKKNGEYRVITPAYCEGAMNGQMNPTADQMDEIILV
jgi:hypothetical protein